MTTYLTKEGQKFGGYRTISDSLKKWRDTESNKASMVSITSKYVTLRKTKFRNLHSKARALQKLNVNVNSK